MASFQPRLSSVFLFCAILFSLQVIPRWWGDSIVTDEEWYLTAAADYWFHGDVWTPFGTSAPGALCGLPLLALDLKPPSPDYKPYTVRSFWFLFMDNGGKLQAVTAWARSVTWLLGLGIGLLLYLFVRGAPWIEGAAVLVLWAFEPTLLAYGGTAQNDMAVAFWFLLSIYLYSRASPGKRIFPFVLVGFTGGLAAAARYNGVLILPVLGVLELLRWWELAFGKSQNTSQSPPLKEGDKGGISFSAPLYQKLIPPFPPFFKGGDNLERIKTGAFARQNVALWTGFLSAVALSFIPGTLLEAGHPDPFSLYWKYLSNYLQQQSAISGLTVFFAGRFWEGGSYLNFPYHFLFKNTLPFCLLLALSAGGVVARKIRIPSYVAVPPALYLGIFYLAVKSMILRHALPAYPFLILIAAKAFRWLWDQAQVRLPRAACSLPALLLLWHAVSVALQFPHHLAYSNELMPGSLKASHLYCFNWDIGQDVKRLAETGRERGWGKVKLMTSQRTDPYFYGLPWESWTRQDLSQPQPGRVYVLDPALVWDDPDYSQLFTVEVPWIHRMAPTGNVAGTWYYYEIPGEASPPSQEASPVLNSFHYYPDGIPPYRTPMPP